MIIALIGPHAIGKTTAIERLSRAMPDVGFVACDNARAFNGRGWEERQGDWLGSTDAKVAVATRCAESDKVWICEGNTARNMPWLKIVPTHLLVHVYASPENFSLMMRERCKRNKKEYREDYWDRVHLEYEAAGRFFNAFGKGRLASSIIYNQLIEDQASDWPRVDEAIIKEVQRLTR